MIIRIWLLRMGQPAVTGIWDRIHICLVLMTAFIAEGGWLQIQGNFREIISFTDPRYFCEILSPETFPFNYNLLNEDLKILNGHYF